MLRKYRVSQEQLYFFQATLHCSYKNDPILKISLLLSRQWIHFYVGIIYGKSCLKWWALFFCYFNRLSVNLLCELDAPPSHFWLAEWDSKLMALNYHTDIHYSKSKGFFLIFLFKNSRNCNISKIKLTLFLKSNQVWNIKSLEFNLFRIYKPKSKH